MINGVAMTEIKNRGYANPDALVPTDWVAEHLSDKNIRIIESNEDQLLYFSGHIPGAVHVDWTVDLNDQIKRDYLDKKGFQNLMSRIGVTPKTTVIFYGDKNNWWACYAYWVFQLFGHKNAKIMDGGRIKWSKEGREITREVPEYLHSRYKAQERNDKKIRAFREQVLIHIDKKLPLVDVRSPEEYSGKRLHMPEYPNEGALRGGHIPGAKNIPWAKAINPDDGTFKSAEELKEIYEKENKLKQTDNIVAYCRIGERSSHTWFVLTNLLGYKNVRNYDGSWTEWGNLVGVPIEK
jgi:thiosulfate/3-mercaptopyruvate sulfurtransferase